MDQHRLIVIGGSAGAAETVTRLLTEFGADFPAPLFVVLHLAPMSNEWLSARFARLTGLRVSSPEQEEPLEVGHIYIARPNRHLIVKEGRVLSSAGPRENLWRPAIDVLFRTAAVAYGSRVIGVLMSGELDDGTAGLQAIKACGGVTVVQDPDDTLHPTMLRTALANVQIDHSATVSELSTLLKRLSNEPAGPAVTIPEQLRQDASIAENADLAPEIMLERGQPTPLSCPECGGPLWSSGKNGHQFRCLVGHALHLHSLSNGTDQEIDRTLWAAIRLFEQRVNIARMMGDEERQRGRQQRADLYDSRADESHRYAQTLRELQNLRQPLLRSSSD
jgi:two-component system, chemotaxis family, protein-glutamate methylesterase/glutaminase